jgi:proteasome lid subunit RPN8/RPN11
MATRLSSDLERELRSHAARDYPHECCGVLLGTIETEPIATYYPEDREKCDLEVRNVEVKVVRALRPLENVHEEGHERRYLIAPQEMFNLEREARAGGQKILGFYHSHPDHPARPSEYDRDWAWPWYTYIIVAVAKGEPKELTAWTLDDDRGAFEEELLNP